MEEIDELLSFLNLSVRDDLKKAALETLLGLTATDDGCTLLSNNTRLLQSLAVLLDDKSCPIAEDSYNALINLSSKERVAVELVSMSDPPILKLIFHHISQDSGILTEAACKLLCNLTRSEACSTRVIQTMQEYKVSVADLVTLICKDDIYRHHLAGVLSNLSQVTQIRSCLMDETQGLLRRLLPYTTYMQSVVRREGIVGVIRNCCFDCERHDWLLSEKLDLLPYLLLPLAGPEEYDEEDTAQLPIELQYLGDEKERDLKPEIRKMLLETILQLCATKPGRKIMQNSGAYLILRELHKWEKTPSVIIACENAVQLLIRDEPDPGMENLNEVDIPDDLIEKFKKMDEDELKDEENRMKCRDTA